jgi:hypothetical protein
LEFGGRKVSDHLLLNKDDQIPFNSFHIQRESKQKSSLSKQLMYASCEVIPSPLLNIQCSDISQAVKVDRSRGDLVSPPSHNSSESFSCSGDAERVQKNVSIVDGGDYFTNVTGLEDGE